MSEPWDEGSSPGRQDRILIVDDTPGIIKVLGAVLESEGYEVRAATGGPEALPAALECPPDLILLDIIMPDVDGYEVCRRLKADAGLRDIPVIFMSALDKTLDKVKAFEVGAVDYVTKPFQFEEVAARVHTHVELQRQKRELRRSYEEQNRLESLRDGLVHMIVHDMRSPVSVLEGALDLLEKREGERLSPEATRMLQLARRSSGLLNEMADCLKDVSRMETGNLKLHLEECDLVSLARRGMDTLAPLLEERRVLLESEADEVRVDGDASLLARVLQNLVANAISFTTPDGQIRVHIAPTPEGVRVEVCDDGLGIAPDYRERIFEKFGQLEALRGKPVYSTGLGLTFCKLAVEAHGGRIGVSSEMGLGSTFWFVLPPAPDKVLAEVLESSQAPISRPAPAPASS